MFRSLRLAISLLTGLPVGRLDAVQASDLGNCTAFFPAAGYVLAALAFAPPYLIIARGSAELSVSAFPLVAVISVALLAWFTRGFHLDGLADVCDGFGGSFERDRRLAIMKDSAIGAFGVIGVVLLLAAKVAALAVLFERPGGVLSGAAAVVLARLFVVAMAALGRYPRDTGTGKHIVGCVPNSALVVAVALCVPCAAVPGAPAMVVAMAATMFVLKHRSDRLIGGVTGDVLGACCELCETVGYIAAASMSL